MHEDGQHSLAGLVAPSLLTSADDVLESYGVAPTEVDEPDGLLDLLPATADELARRTGRPVALISQTLLQLELAGRLTVNDGIYRA